MHARIVITRPLRVPPTRALTVSIRASSPPLADGIVRNVRLASEMFTAAVTVYCGLNYVLYRTLRTRIERELQKKKDETKK